MKKQYEKIEQSLLRYDISHRGGGVEISLDSYGFEGEKMSAYQNYLGGGMLGRVVSDCTLFHKDKPYKGAKRLENISTLLIRYYLYESGLSDNLDRPISAY